MLALAMSSRRPPRHAQPERLAARKALGQTLARARGFWGLTQPQVGEVVGVSKLTVGNWEAGEGEPGALDLLALAKYFGVPVEALCTGEGLTFDPAAPAGRREPKP